MKKNQIRKSVAALAMAVVVGVSLLGYGCGSKSASTAGGVSGDFTGTAFISCLIAGVIGKDEFEKLSSMDAPTEEGVLAIVEPGLDYLRELSPYLWKEGATFPADASTVATMYADGELVLNMGYGAPQDLVNTGQLPESESAAFAEVPLGSTQIPLDELLDHRIAEAAGPVIPILEKLWLERVAQG